MGVWMHGRRKPDPGRVFSAVPWESVGRLNRKRAKEGKAAGLSAGAKTRAITDVLRALFLPFSVWRNAADGPAWHAALHHPPAFLGESFSLPRRPSWRKPRASPNMKPFAQRHYPPWDA